MAKKVYDTEEISLQDDTEVVLKPLAIGRLRRFMDAWEKFSEVENDDEGFNVFINCAGIALEENFKGKFDSLKASKDEQESGEVLSGEYKEYLEEVLDLATIYKILDVGGGVKLSNENLATAAEVLAATESE